MKRFLFSCMFFLIISCSNPTQDELLSYVNTEMPKIAKLEADAISSYENVTGGNYKDDMTMYTTLRDEVIPNYRSFVKELESISNNLKTPEVQKLHETYIEAANTQYSAFFIMLTAVEKQDYSLVNQANEKLDKGRKLVRQWQIDLKVLTEKNNVKLNK